MLRKTSVASATPPDLANSRHGSSALLGSTDAEDRLVAQAPQGGAGVNPRAMTISAASLLTLQSYSLTRRQHKQRLIRHRRERSLMLGPCMHLQFEDERTIRYQIQEVLHAERAGGVERMQHEIDTYAHLVPDGTHWKATLLIELPDAAERQRELPPLNEAAHRLYVELPRHARVFALANEDLADRHRSRPSAVHFLRFQFPESLRVALLAGATATLGCAHEQYEFRRVIPPASIARLRRDLVVPAHRFDRCDEQPAEADRARNPEYEAANGPATDPANQPEAKPLHRRSPAALNGRP